MSALPLKTALKHVLFTGFYSLEYEEKVFLTKMLDQMKTKTLQVFSQKLLMKMQHDVPWVIKQQLFTHHTFVKKDSTPFKVSSFKGF